MVCAKRAAPVEPMNSQSCRASEPNSGALLMGDLEAARRIDPATLAPAIGSGCFGAAPADGPGQQAAVVAAEVATEPLVTPMAPTAAAMMAPHEFEIAMCLEGSLRQAHNGGGCRRARPTENGSREYRERARSHPTSPLKTHDAKNAEPRASVPTDQAGARPPKSADRICRRPARQRAAMEFCDYCLFRSHPD